MVGHFAIADRISCSARTSTFNWESPKALEVPTVETEDVLRRVREMEDMEWRRVGRTECWRSKRVVGVLKMVERWDWRVWGLGGRDVIVGVRWMCAVRGSRGL